MKIKQLNIKNFKNIKQIDMNNIPDLVVIAGPNGCGKTSIFDAVRIFKAIVGPYHGGELGDIQSRELRSELRHVVNFSSDYAEITMGIQVSESEKKYLIPKTPTLENILASNQGLLRSTIRISKEGRVDRVIDSPPLSELLRHYDPTDEIGTFEYIPSNREAQMGELGSVALDPQALEQEKLERTANARAKFSRLKYYLAMMVLYDKMKLSDEAAGFMAELQSFFKGFFFPKEFEGVSVDRTLRWRFPVRTPDGTHDIDFLSSGELEVLMTYTQILKMKHTGSVILFDEPDLHLNAALERKVVGSLKKIVNAGNQVWLSTHSLEIIGTVPLENLYKMHFRLPEGKSNQIELCSSKSDRFETFKSLGASTGIQLISQKIVFVEGPTDKEILESFFEDFGDIVSFVETKGVNPLMGVGQTVTDLIDQVAKYETFYLIRDRDFLDDAYVENIQKKYAGKMFVWSMREIENYLLNPKSLLEVMKQLQIKSFETEASIAGALKNIANDLKISVIADMVCYEINQKLMEKKFGLPQASSIDELRGSILEIGNTQKDRFSEQFGPDALTKLFDEKKKLVEETWESKWLHLSDGKRILQEFINRHIKIEGQSVDITALKNLIISNMKLTNAVPTEIEEVVKKKILSDLLAK